ncbi:MAG: aldo/keto reductase [Gemmatimonadetes bacterium]|nr:aldo/keto reductase [Gemmatimonadota bacterium]
MERRSLGTGGLAVSALGMGCMTITTYYGAADEAGGGEAIERALDLGIDFFDTADVYAQGRNEEVVGRALSPHRGRVVLATKGGLVPRGQHAGGVDGRPEHILAACEASLRRLNTDRIDLYYLHRADPAVPIEESVGAMARLVEEGKVRYLGLSEVQPGTLRRAHAVHPIAALQNEYSLWTRDPEAGVLPVCRELGIGLVAFSPLGRGLFGGRLQSLEGMAPDDFRRQIPRFDEDNFARNLEVVRRLEAFAAELHCTPAQLALAWVLGRGPDIVPIPGTKRPASVEENVGALAVRLPASALEWLDSVLPGQVAGARYNEQLTRMTEV